MPELNRMIKFFAANKLVLHLDKSNIMKFITKNSLHSKLHIGYKEKYIEETVNTQCLGLQIDNHIHWKNHIEQTIPKLSGAAVSILVTLTPSNKFTVYIYLHSIVKYGIIL
jgi:predicted metal-dependent hydrolase